MDGFQTDGCADGRFCRSEDSLNVDLEVVDLLDEGQVGVAGNDDVVLLKAGVGFQ